METKMKLYPELSLNLRSLVIFRNLLSDPVVARLLALCEAERGNITALVTRYAGFARALYASTAPAPGEDAAVSGNLGAYLLRVLSEDENFYLLRRAGGCAPDPELEALLDRELDFFDQVALFSSEKVRAALGWNGALPDWKSGDAHIRETYRRRMGEIGTRGYGIFAKHHIFVLRGNAVAPVRNPDPTALSQLRGYEQERGEIVRNTEALLNGKPAANILLYGDAGTGKSSTVKAVANEYKARGLRLIELKKDQLGMIPWLLDQLGNNPLKFILFIDDLSFNCDDGNFSALKAVLEGSVAAKAPNLVVYATSNRRHLVKESFSDRAGDEIHFSDTMEELNSLSARFGLTVTFAKPNRDGYLDILMDLARQYGVTTPEDSLKRGAEVYAIERGGRSPRVAKQYIELVKSRE